MKSSVVRDRIASLDILRALAIVLVVIHHYGYHLVHWMTFGRSPAMMVVRNFSWIGVDLFFVLSGWLIGGLYFREEVTFGDVRVGRFWARRWMRTLPPYYAVFALSVLLADTGGAWPPLREFFFLQNYVPGFHYTMIVSWSLCVEEHFYLVLPIVLFATRRHRRMLALAGIPAMLVVVAAARGATALAYGAALVEHMDFTHVHTPTHLRIDTLLIGVWLALVYYHLPAWWARIEQYAARIGAFGLAGAIATVIAFGSSRFTVPSGPVFAAVGYSAIGLSFGAILAWAVCDGAALRVIPIRIAQPIALSSYSIYLTHMQALIVSRRIWYVWPTVFTGAYVLRLVVLIAICAAFALLAYHLVERTSIYARDRLVPNRKRVAPPPVRVPVSA